MQGQSSKSNAVAPQYKTLDDNPEQPSSKKAFVHGLSRNPQKSQKS